MVQTHDSLSRDYEVSCPELDYLVDLVRDYPHVYGARMMGGGFGGCTINLVKPGSVDRSWRNGEGKILTKIRHRNNTLYHLNQFRNKHPSMSMKVQMSESAKYPHRRKNILTEEWILVSPHRTQRPWQGEISSREKENRPAYDPECYLCPGNKRANGETNPRYNDTFVFTNDFSALLPIPRPPTYRRRPAENKSEKGICRVVNFSPRHDLTLAEMDEAGIEKVITVWQDEFKSLGSDPRINHVQIFENKGAMMGNSNPHPHGQIWAQESIPREPAKELQQFKRYYSKKKRSLLADYLRLELRLNERIVYENTSFAVVVPFWAVWPYETMIISKRKIATILRFTEKGKKRFCERFEDDHNEVR